MEINMSVNLRDIDTRTLKQELFIIKKILEQVHFRSEGSKIKLMFSVFDSKHLPLSTYDSFNKTYLEIIVGFLKLLERTGSVQHLNYSDVGTMNMSVSVLPIVDKIRLYKTFLLNELRSRGEIIDEHFSLKQLLRNGQLIYDLDSNELKFGGNEPIKLLSSSYYGKFLILLMDNLNQLVTYTQICNAVGINYGGVNPESDSSIKRQINKLRDDLILRLKKAGFSNSQTKKLIVARNGYKMNQLN